MFTNSSITNRNVKSRFSEFCATYSSTIISNIKRLGLKPPLYTHALNKGIVISIQPSTLEALARAYENLQPIIADLYVEFEKAMENENYRDASLLQSRAERLFEEAEAILIVIAEQENG